jgi:hypothetical protein
MNWQTGFILSTISIGCAVAAAGELRFSIFGFACQTVAVFVSK